MKKILFAALAAAFLATGCQKTEIINRVGDSMTFSTHMGKLTKANGTALATNNDGLLNLQAQDFRVWAYGAYEDENTSKTEMNTMYDDISNLLVSYTVPEGATKGTWGTTKEYYWPGENKALKFFAVSANSAFLTDAESPVEITLTSNETGVVLPSLVVKSFTVDNGANENTVGPNVDLMVADFVQQHQEKKVVNLNFRHTLSKIEFVFKTLAAKENETAPTVYVQSLKVDDLQTSGTLTVTPKEETSLETNTNTPSAVAEVNLKWNQADTKATFTDKYTETVTFDTDVEETAKADNTALKLTTGEQMFATWLMLPQNIEGKKVEVTYVINKRQFKSVFALDKGSLSAWSPNQHVKYTVTLAPNVISFDPTVSEWDNETPKDYQN